MNREEFLSVITFSLSSICAEVWANGEIKKVVVKTSRVCENCKYNLGRNIAFEKGVRDAVVDLKNHTIMVTFNPEKTNIEKLKNYIISLGFDADELKANIYHRERLRDCCLMDITICK